MNFGSVCSGIEAASVAWEPLGWKAQFLSEIEPFPAAVLAHHYPTVPNLGDMTKFKEWGNHDIDVLVGGTPCQSFSVAGLRKGLADPRGNLMLTYLAIADKYRPDWLVWENVPGVLSSNGGKDFGTFLGGLGELGYGFAYRVLDAQHFGVPQRRRRVFVVGCLGDWRLAAAVLFERHSLQGNPAPSRQARQAVAGTISSRTTGGGGLGTDFELAGGLQVASRAIAGALTSNYEKQPDNSNTSLGPNLVIQSGTLCMATGQAGAEISPTLNCNHEAPIVFDAVTNTLTSNGDAHSGFRDEHGLVAAFKGGQGSKAGGIGYDENLSPTLSSADSGSNRTPTLMTGMQVRRLTPRECERLQGFPDDYTQVLNRGKRAADGPRYKALGNSMAVPVMAWIGQRIEAADTIRTARAAA